MKRLKKGHIFIDEYFDRQLACIREIRLSERKFYQKITDIYVTAFDCDKSVSTTKKFSNCSKQNALAIHRHTATELIVERVDAKKEYMRLTSWGAAPYGKIKKPMFRSLKITLTKKR